MNKKSQYHHGDLRNALIESALLLLEEKGIDGLSLRDVAKQAGVSHNAPYRHFQNKTELLAILAEQGFVNLRLVIAKVTQDHNMSVSDQLIAAGVAYVHEAIQHPEMIRLMFGGLLNFSDCPPDLEQAAELAYQSLNQIIGQGIADGSFQQQDKQILTVTAWSTMHGLAMLFIAGHFRCAIDDQQALEKMVLKVATTIVQGIKH